MGQHVVHWAAYKTWPLCICPAGPSVSSPTMQQVPPSFVCASECSWIPGATACLRCINGIPEECPDGICPSGPPREGEAKSTPGKWGPVPQVLGQPLRPPALLAFRIHAHGRLPSSSSSGECVAAWVFQQFLLGDSQAAWVAACMLLHHVVMRVQLGLLWWMLAADACLPPTPNIWSCLHLPLCRHAHRQRQSHGCKHRRVPADQRKA